jgi:hypothetical protein
MKEKDLSFLFDHYPKKLLQDFDLYHQKNPHVYEEFSRLAKSMYATGRTKYSSKCLINVLRWNMDLRTTGDVFKINDKFQSIYGRLFVKNNPEYIDFFEFRIRENNGTPSKQERERTAGA